MELVIGANIGTVFSSIMAALSAKSHTKDAFQVAYAHLLFNTIGLLSLYPIPKIRNLALIQPAKHIEKLLKKSKGFAVAYLTSLYIALPTLILLTRMASNPSNANDSHQAFSANITGASNSTNHTLATIDSPQFNCSSL